MVAVRPISHSGSPRPRSEAQTTRLAWFTRQELILQSEVGWVTLDDGTRTVVMHAGQHIRGIRCTSEGGIRCHPDVCIRSILARPQAPCHPAQCHVRGLHAVVIAGFNMLFRTSARTRAGARRARGMHPSRARAGKRTSRASHRRQELPPMAMRKPLAPTSAGRTTPQGGVAASRAGPGL